MQQVAPGVKDGASSLNQVTANRVVASGVGGGGGGGEGCCACGLCVGVMGVSEGCFFRW